MDTSEYSSKKLAKQLMEFIDNHNLKQLVKKPTRHRIVNYQKGKSEQESLLDHLYSNNTTIVKNITNNIMEGSDHNIIGFELEQKHTGEKLNKKIITRDWKYYSKERLNDEIMKQNLDELGNKKDINSLNSGIEQVLRNAIDKISPWKTIRIRNRNQIIDTEIEKIKNKRNRMYKTWKMKKSENNFNKLRSLNEELIETIKRIKKKRIYQKYNPKNPKDMWDKVNLITGKNTANIISIEDEDGLHTNDNILAQKFSDHFSKKIRILRKDIKIEDTGHGNEMFELSEYKNEEIKINIETVRNILRKLQNKKSAGPDEIPMKIIKDSEPTLSSFYHKLFQMILKERKIPEIWKQAKIRPLHKKGNKLDINNYRPISNLCSLSKVFEKCILEYIDDLQMRAGVDLTGDWQHGFKKKRGTTTALLCLQNKLAKQLEKGKYAAIYSLDLSSAFDMLDAENFRNRITNRGLPRHLTDILFEIVNNREQYVNVGEENSTIEKMEAGCAQGSVLGSVIFNLYISPLSEIVGQNITGYADDSYLLCHSNNLNHLTREITQKLEKHTDWLKRSGLVVNMKKTELMICHRKEKIKIKIKLSEDEIETVEEIKALGVILDQNLKWNKQVKKVANSCKSTLYGLKKIRKYFQKEDFKRLLTSFLYSKMYYCGEIWLNNTLLQEEWERLNRIHRLSVRILEEDYRNKLSHEDLEIVSQRATPKEGSNFLEAKMLFKIIENEDPEELFTDILCQAYTEPRWPSRLKTFDNSTHKIGKHILVNRIVQTTRKLNFDWYGLNLTYAQFRTECKMALFRYFKNENSRQ